ncbi:MAG: LysM peptidoglycan-binding domain-containing protein, partial [Myxococcales bacterium]|nr:LysM peptidoglycan-binding domain-containing protein [Myxococcales bacterium]
MISRILFTTGVVSAMAVVGPVRAQGEDDALSSDESGTAMWMDAMDDAHARDKRVPTKAGVSVASEAGSGVYRVHEGDTLWDISSKELGNAYDWPRLWSYNPEITNPHWIYPDSEVRLAPAGGGVATSTAPTSSLT